MIVVLFIIHGEDDVVFQTQQRKVEDLQSSKKWKKGQKYNYYTKDTEGDEQVVYPHNSHCRYRISNPYLYPILPLPVRATRAGSY